MSKRDIVVLSYDAISPLGYDLDKQWQRLVAGESGISRLNRFKIDNEFPVQVAGQVPDIFHLDFPFLSARHRAAWSSPVFPYSLLSVARALRKSGVAITPSLAPRVAVTYSTAIGGLDAVLVADRKMREQNRLPHPYANPNSCINMVGGKIAILSGAEGPIVTTITACATGLTSIISGGMLLTSGQADVAICGAVDFPLVEPIVAGFYTMNGVYIPARDEHNPRPEQASRPFSLNRRGFVISEGAGAMILAGKDFAQAHGLPWLAELQGWSMTSDAHHFVAPQLKTVQRCMAGAIEQAGLATTDIDAVNAHAASTKVGDKVEFQALEAVFAGNIPPLSANKSSIGHAMGASSIIETIFMLKGMEEQVLPPTLNYLPDPEIEVDCVSDGVRKHKQEFVLKNSFGFGGCNVCAVFKMG